MSERRSLLQHVIDNADDDAPRLVFADWLDEHGEADRAAFIRLQIEHEHRFTADPFDAFKLGFVRWRYPKDGLSAGLSEYEAAMISEERYVDRNRSAWYKEAPSNSTPTFRRGFIESIVVTASGFAKQASRFWRDSPIRAIDVRVGTRTRNLDGFLARPELARLRAIDFRATYLGDDTVGKLSSPRLHRLQQLALPLNRLTVTAALSLASAPFEDLRVLNLNGNELRDAGVLALLSAPWLAGLSALGLHRCVIGDTGAIALAGSPQVAGLTLLDLEANNIGNAGALALAASPHLGRLAKLGLKQNAIEASAADALRVRFGDRVEIGD